MTTTKPNLIPNLGSTALTPTEADCLAHRLTLPCALANVIACERGLDDDDPATYELCTDLCTLLLAGRLDDALQRDTTTTCEILADCIEGSTWMVDHPGGDGSDDPAERMQFVAYGQAAARLQAKLETIISTATGQPCRLQPAPQL